MNWIPTTERLPDRIEGKRYSQVFCVCVCNNEVIILCFNHEENCWDQEDADDYFCDINEVSHWMLLPELPKK